MPPGNNGSGRLVLAVDFPGRREEARVADLDLEAAGFEVRYLLEESLSQASDARGYAADLLAVAGLGGRRPEAVLAYCMAAPLAQEVGGTAGGMSPGGHGLSNAPRPLWREVRLMCNHNAYRKGKNGDEAL
jgi:hypothetical protein